MNEGAKICPSMYLWMRLFDLETGTQARRDYEVPINTFETT